MQWFERCRARLLIDNHITEDSPDLMSSFDPERYAEMAAMAGVDAAMVYACCHNGNCYYPTEVGHMHANLKGRDIFGETIRSLRARGIVPLAYTTVIYHNSSARAHPEWRQMSFSRAQRDGRYWYCCPSNEEYRAFARAQLVEILRYDIEGVFVDMTFWPTICGCPKCRARYRGEVGEEIPQIVDWRNRGWVRFQRVRERWMADFARELTSAAKTARPGVSVAHQMSPLLHGWKLGQSVEMAEASDFMAGDFYGGQHQHCLAAKLFAALSPRAPFEFMTSRCVNLYDHTSTKSEQELAVQAALSLAHGGAYTFGDAINPDGTLVPSAYRRLGNVTSALKVFAETISQHRPRLAGDVGLYFCLRSHVEMAAPPVDLREMRNFQSDRKTDTAGSTPQLELLGASMALSQAKIPYRIIPEGQLDHRGIRALVLPNCPFMPKEDVARIRDFVVGGGTLIATGLSSLYDVDGASTGDFQLADVFGVTCSGNTSSTVSYLAYQGDLDAPPDEDGSGAEEQHVSAESPSPLVRTTSGRALAWLCQTLFPPHDPEHYASIHSDPPGPRTSYVGLAVNHFGKGRCLYLAPAILASRNSAQLAFMRRLFLRYARSGLIVAPDAPHRLELTLLRSSREEAWLLCLVNDQRDDDSGVPVLDTTVELDLGFTAKKAEAVLVSSAERLPLVCTEGRIRVRVPRVDIVEIVAIRNKP